MPVLSVSSSCHTASMDFHDSLYHQLLLAGLLDHILCPYRDIVDKFLLVSQHWHEAVHRRMSLMSLSLLLQQCSAGLVCLIWIVLEI